MSTKLAALIAVAALAVAGCAATPSPVAAPAAGSQSIDLYASPEALLAQLTVADEDTGAHYNRDEWGIDWAYHNGCTTRELVLIAQSTGAQRGKGCTPVCPDQTTPCWTSPYDGYTTSDASDLQIDHRVSVREAARSRVLDASGKPTRGAARVWRTDEKNRFYEDQDNLVAVTKSVNEAKNDHDPGIWKPSQQTAWCEFATAYIKTKLTWHLTADPAEKTGLQEMLTACSTGGHS
jgi:hypothetical protein